MPQGGGATTDPKMPTNSTENAQNRVKLGHGKSGESRGNGSEVPGRGNALAPMGAPRRGQLRREDLGPMHPAPRPGMHLHGQRAES